MQTKYKGFQIHTDYSIEEETRRFWIQDGARFIEDCESLSDGKQIINALTEDMHAFNDGPYSKSQR